MKAGAFAAVLALALSLPGMAFAANTATFSGAAPKAGTFIKSAKPTVTVTVYDRYGVKGSANYSMVIDGVKRPATIKYISGYGYKKFRLSYTFTSNMSSDDHDVVVTVKDLAAKRSTYKWSFSVDAIAPTTSNSAPPLYPKAAFIRLLASDNDEGSGVENTFYRLDGGPAIQADTIFGPELDPSGSFSIGAHTIEYWSVDEVGNVESHKTVTFTVYDQHALPTYISRVSGCIAVGCHFTDAENPLMAIHKNNCGRCHSIAAKADCITCHGPNPANHATHVPIVSATEGTATDCLGSSCHGASGANVTSIHGLCSTCHNPSEDSSIPAETVLSAIADGDATCET